MLLNLHYGKKSAPQVPQSSWCCCAESSGVSSEVHSSWWWYPATPVAREKIFLPPNSYMKRVGTCLMLWKLLVWHIAHPVRSGAGNTLPPRPSLPTPHQIVQHHEPRAAWPFNPHRKDLSRNRPAVPCQPPAALGQRFIIWVPVAVSTCSSSVLPAKKTGLIYLAFQQIRGRKKKII